MRGMNSQQQLLYALYVFCKNGEKCGARVRAILDNAQFVPSPKFYEPFSCESPSVPLIGGDF